LISVSVITKAKAFFQTIGLLELTSGHRRILLHSKTGYLSNILAI
jgi:hypothetical protein